MIHVRPSIETGADRGTGRAGAGFCAGGLAILAMALAGAIGGFGTARAQVVRSDFAITNGTINAEVLSGNTLYVGGMFTRVGSVTGAGTPLDATSGTVLPDLARVIGEVDAVVADGSGGWFIGGLFSTVGGLPRTNLAHILADQSVTAWNPGTNGNVRALAVDGSTVYVGGDFTSAGGQSRSRIAAIDASTGLATAWNPIANGTVRALVVNGTTVYAAGAFTAAGGLTRNRIAALDAGTGSATTWNPNANSMVLTLAIDGGTIYAGGQFTNIGGQARSRIAALDGTTGLATSWNPIAGNTVSTLAVRSGVVYAGGQFLSLGGQSRTRIGAVDAVTGLATAWNPNAGGSVSTLALDGSVIYAGGDFLAIGGQPRSRVAAIDLTTGLASPWDPGAYGSVLAIATAPGVVFVGGSFNGIGGVRRDNLAAIDVTTGAATSWDPDADNQVLAMKMSGGAVIVGGSFANVGGQPRNDIAAIDAVTGAATAWNPNADGQVFALAARNGVIYAGGDFFTIGGQPRSSIAALDATTGAATAWSPEADGLVLAIEPAADAIYVGGAFFTIGGQPRNSIAALDPITGAATSWDAGSNGTVRAIIATCDRIYAGGFFTMIGGQMRNSVAALDPVTGAAGAWNPNANGPVFGLALSGGRLYVSGVLNTIGGQPRNRIAALDPVTGLATAWNPNANATVRVMVVGGGQVYAAGSFTSMGGLPISNLAAIQTDASASCPTITLAPLDLPSGVVGTAYTQAITPSGGVSPYCFAVTAGAVPAGLTVSAGGQLSGTPSATGTSVFTITASDANGCTGSESYTLSIFATPPASTVAANTSGLCISPAHPCVAVPFVYTRAEATGARGISVTFQLEVSKLALCTPGTPAVSIHAGSWLSGFANTSFQVVDHGGGSYTVDQTILGTPCGVTVGGELFTVDVASVGSDGNGAITVTAVKSRDCDSAPIPAATGPVASIPIESAPPTGISDLVAAQVTSNNGPGATTGITITWSTGGLGTVSLYRAPFGSYPVYDAGGPISPPNVASAPGAPWTLVASGVTTGYVDHPPQRGFWYYAALVTDACGLASSPSNPSPGALNYHLGDVSDGAAAGTGNNHVGGEDLSLLGVHYGIGASDIASRGVEYLDVGPTTDAQPTSRPAPDRLIDFEDLMMFSTNFMIVSAPAMAARRTIAPARALDGGEPEAFAVAGPSLVEPGSEVTAVIRVKGQGRMQGFSVRLAWDPSVVEPVGMSSSGFVESQGGIVLSPAGGTVDAALLGVGGDGMRGDGEVARFRFRVLRTGDAGFRIAEVKARDRENHPLGQGGVAEHLELSRPARTELMNPWPNPFRGRATVAYSLAEPGDVELTVYGVDGRRVRTLARGWQEAGMYRLEWDGQDDARHPTGSGIYYARLSTAGRHLTRMLVRLR